MGRAIIKVGLLILAVLLLSGAALSVAVYGSVDPCTMLTEEVTRRARDAAELSLEPDDNPESLEEAAEQARDALSGARDDVDEAVSEARDAVEDLDMGECVRELWGAWF